MLPQRILAKKTKWVWIALLAMAPLAYYAGVRLILNIDPSARIGINYDREQLIVRAEQAATQAGVNVAGWDVYIRFLPNTNLFYYYKYRSGAERELAKHLAPDAEFKVRFRAPDRSENIEVAFDVDGHRLGFTHNISKTKTGKDPGDEKSREIAEAAFKARLAAAGITVPVELKSAGTVSNEPPNTGIARQYTWSLPFATLPELKLEGIIKVRDGVLISDRIKGELDPVFTSTKLINDSGFKLLSVLLYGLCIAIVVIFGIYRFVQRAREKEISYSRISLIALIFAAVMFSFAFITDAAFYDTSETPDLSVSDAAIMFIASIFYLLFGLIIGLAYGSGEGDMREGFPGKLTSLDSLLTGKIFSRNVARSVVTGWAFGGWLMLGVNLITLPWLKNPLYGESYGPLDAWFGNAPWLLPYVAWMMDSILIVIIGLLIPLPFLRSRIKSLRIILPLLFLFTWVACSGPYMSFHPWGVMLLMAAFRACLVLTVFFKFDLLATIVCLASPTFVAFTTAMAAQPSDSLHRSGLISLSFASLVLIVEIYFAFRGRIYNEDEVRPIYARNLAQRVAMQAEVGAAREAQKRLMPESIPNVPGLSIAGTCLAAHEVGGDFFEVFEIEPGKIGVLIAEGGGQGIGSALSIAFAKGFVMPRIKSDRYADNSPIEVLRSLQKQLSSSVIGSSGGLSGSGQMGLAYAVVDTADGSVRYAKTAGYPAVLIGKAGKQHATNPADERNIRFSSGRTEGEENDYSITASELNLDTGDSVIFYTDGLAKSWSGGNSSPDREFGEFLDDCTESSSEEMNENLMKRIEDTAKRARKAGFEDDLTALVIKINPPPVNEGEEE
ncbi:MAG: SpoIIE family protein phosphatase [Acidobacteria bacterium]|nr:SpoIIE family protein phosphatase [Acidobacteriota bacterium]